MGEGAGENREGESTSTRSEADKPIRSAIDSRPLYIDSAAARLAANKELSNLSSRARREFYNQVNETFWGKHPEL